MVAALGRLRTTALEGDRNSQRLKQDWESVLGTGRLSGPRALLLCACLRREVSYREGAYDPPSVVTGL